MVPHMGSGAVMCPDLFVDFGTRSIQSYGCLLTGSGYPQIFSTPSSKTIRWTPNVFELQEHAQGSLITLPSLVGLALCTPPRDPKLLRYLPCDAMLAPYLLWPCVCLSVCWQTDMCESQNSVPMMLMLMVIFPCYSSICISL